MSGSNPFRRRDPGADTIAPSSSSNAAGLYDDGSNPPLTDNADTSTTRGRADDGKLTPETNIPLG